MKHRVKVRLVRRPIGVFNPFGPTRWWLVEIVGSIFPTPVAMAPTLRDAHAIARLVAVGRLLDQGGEVKTRTEWGYRIGTEEVWETDQGMDGTWTPWMPSLGMNHVDVYDDEQGPRAIRAELDRAGHGEKGQVIRRPVTTVTGRAAVHPTVATTDPMEGLS